MTRTINEIQNGMLTAIASDEVLSVQLNSTSKVAIFRLFTYVVASAIWIVEMLFDNHKKEVDDILELRFPHRPSWYRNKAKAFQYGFDLIADTDKFNNDGYTDDQIEASKIVKYSAVTQNGGQLQIKIAAESAGVLSPITMPQKTAFDFYLSEIADCGVKYIVVNHLPDILLLNMQIYINPLVLDENGMSIINGNYPVQDALLEYMKELPFNGELVLAHLVDKLQLAEGVIIPNILTADSQAIDINTGLYSPPEAINVKTVPESGYFTIPNFDGISYVV